VQVEASDVLRRIRERMEAGLRAGKSSKQIKKEINDWLVRSIGYGEYGSDLAVPDILYEFYRNEAVIETLGRERNPTLLWEIREVEESPEEVEEETQPQVEDVNLAELFPLNANSLRKIRTSRDVERIIAKMCAVSSRCRDEIICHDDFGQPVHITEITTNPNSREVIRILFSLHGCEYNPYMNVISPLAGLDIMWHYITTNDPTDLDILRKYKLKFCFVSPSGFDLRARQMERVGGEVFYWLHGRRPIPYGDVLPDDINSWLERIRNPKNIRAVAADTSREIERFGMDLHETQSLRDEQMELMIEHPLLRGLLALETYADKSDEKIGEGVARQLKGKNLLQSWNEIWLKLLYQLGTESTLYQRYLIKKQIKPRGDGRAEEGELIRKGTNVYNIFAHKKYNIPVITFEACGRPYVTDSQAFASLRNAVIAGIRSFYELKKSGD
jgi:hypothetical protein